MVPSAVLRWNFACCNVLFGTSNCCLMSGDASKFKETTCARCETSYVCKLFMHCWCEEIQIPERLVEHLQMNYHGCLCKQCMDELMVEFSE